MLSEKKSFSDRRNCQLNNTVKLHVTTADTNTHFDSFFRKTCVKK